MNKLNSEEKILFIKFSENQKSFILGTNFGIKIYNSSDCTKLYEKNLENPIILADMMESESFVAFVGGNNKSKFPPNKIIIWENIKEEIFNEIELIDSFTKRLYYSSPG